jgi:hypothetical protein
MPVSAPRRRCVGRTPTAATPAVGTVPPGTDISKLWVARRADDPVAVERADEAVRIDQRDEPPSRVGRNVPAEQGDGRRPEERVLLVGGTATHRDRPRRPARVALVGRHLPRAFVRADRITRWPGPGAP